jgi:hypothetical protein
MSSFHPDGKEAEARLVKYALGCSDLSLDTLFLQLMKHDRELKKEIAEKIEQAIENNGLARAIQIFREHPELRHPQAIESADPKKSQPSPRNTKTA